MVDAALKSQMKHSWYLTDENVTFSLFDDHLCPRCMCTREPAPSSTLTSTPSWTITSASLHVLRRTCTILDAHICTLACATGNLHHLGRSHMHPSMCTREPAPAQLWALESGQLRVHSWSRTCLDSSAKSEVTLRRCRSAVSCLG